MGKIITDLDVLSSEASKPLEFISDNLEEMEAAKAQGLDVVKELRNILKRHPEINALSAPQIGTRLRIACVKFNDGIKTFINPVITKKSGGIIGVETCASMPGKEILTRRPEEITLVYYTDEFKYEDNKLLGDACRILDQQVQLFDAVTPQDVGLVSDIEHDGSLYDLSEEDFKEISEFYVKFVEIKSKALKEHIEQDEEISKQFNNLKFTESVITGHAAVVDMEREKINELAKRAQNQEKKAIQKAEFNNFVHRCGKRRKK